MQCQQMSLCFFSFFSMSFADDILLDKGQVLHTFFIKSLICYCSTGYHLLILFFSFFFLPFIFLLWRLFCSFLDCSFYLLSLSSCYPQVVFSRLKLISFHLFIDMLFSSSFSSLFIIILFSGGVLSCMYLVPTFILALFCFFPLFTSFFLPIPLHSVSSTPTLLSLFYSLLKSLVVPP